MSDPSVQVLARLEAVVRYGKEQLRYCQDLANDADDPELAEECGLFVQSLENAAKHVAALLVSVREHELLPKPERPTMELPGLRRSVAAHAVATVERRPPSAIDTGTEGATFPFPSVSSQVTVPRG